MVGPAHTGLALSICIVLILKGEFLCIMDCVMPKILYHPEEAMYDYWAKEIIDR